HGATAVKLLVAAIKDGTELPTQTFTDPEFINAENFASTYKAKLCK
ncbi:MAG: arabinose ABC transporter substrate-binding protein, partial [Bauldia sp.]